MGRVFCAIFRKMLGPATVLAGGILLCAAPPHSPDGKTPKQNHIVPGNGGVTGATYVGMEACRTCHEEVVKNFEKNSVHAELNKDQRRGFVNNACEACHGPGSKHIENPSPSNIVQPAHLAVRQEDGICLSCHLNQETQVGRIQSSHAHNQVPCLACHTIHGTGEALVARKIPTINKLCSGCHTSEWAQFYRPYAHRVTQNGMSCVDCHNPHGSFLPGNRQMYMANEPGCFRCHSEYRGPFPFEHAAIKLGGCPACHVPHGSSNPKMLIRQNVKILCLECHGNPNPAPSVAASYPKHLGGIPPSFHNLAEPLFQNCTICHVKIHGSYANRYLEQ